MKCLRCPASSPKPVAQPKKPGRVHAITRKASRNARISQDINQDIDMENARIKKEREEMKPKTEKIAGQKRKVEPRTKATQARKKKFVITVILTY